MFKDADAPENEQVVGRDAAAGAAVSVQLKCHAATPATGNQRFELAINVSR